MLTSEWVFMVIVLDERRHPAALRVHREAATKLKRQEDFEKLWVVQVWEFFNRKSNIWHMYHRQKKRSCKESSVRWRRWWGSWTGQSINSSPTQYFCSLFILLLFSSCGSHSLCWLHRRGPIGGLGSLPATHRAGGAEEGGLWVERGGQCSVLAGQVWRRRGLCQIHSRPQGLSTQCF